MLNPMLSTAYMAFDDIIAIDTIVGSSVFLKEANFSIICKKKKKGRLLEEIRIGCSTLELY